MYTINMYVYVSRVENDINFKKLYAIFLQLYYMYVIVLEM